MRTFMIDRQVTRPPGHAERGCLLVSYRLPLLPHCHVLCHEADERPASAAPADLLAFCLGEAERLALAAVGDPQAFVLVHSGLSARKRAGWHLHVFVVQHRWQKAWLYLVLGVKNASLAAWQAVAPARPIESAPPDTGHHSP